MRSPRTTGALNQPLPSAPSITMRRHAMPSGDTQMAGSVANSSVPESPVSTKRPRNVISPETCSYGPRPLTSETSLQSIDDGRFSGVGVSQVADGVASGRGSNSTGGGTGESVGDMAGT